MNKVLRPLPNGVLRELPNSILRSLALDQLKEFRATLLAWFREFQRDLPWRRTCDPYRIWISEIMLQQTRVAAAIPYYEKFLERFPDVRALAGAPEEEVLRLWSGLGYYSRARNLQQAAKQIVAKFGGEFPQTKQEVLELAGIGEYTAAAILSMAFGAELAVLDGNVARVLARLDAVRGDLRSPQRWKSLQNCAEELLAREAPGEWNQAMMELGATLCTPRAPQCLLCPVQRLCQARKLGIAEELPERRKKRAMVTVQLACGVFLDGHGNSLLLAPPDASLKEHRTDDHVPSLVARLWHFPTVAVTKSPEATLKKWLAKYQRSGATGWEFEALKLVRHTVTYRKIVVTPFLVHVKRLPRMSGAKPLPLAEISDRPISNLTRKVARSALKQAGLTVALTKTGN